MAKENKSRYAILGMLSTEPMSGYDIKKAIENSVANFWNESYGQIYPILKQLADMGLTTSHTEKQEGKPERYVYTLTDKGREELLHWLTEPVEHAVERNELLLKLFFGHEVPVTINIEHVRQFRVLMVELLEKYTGIIACLNEHCMDSPDIPYSRITVSYGLHRTRALLQWCDETIELLQQM
ncbi:MAG: PadR family transcriptional regulator [Ktedonobacteraceae bacterium]